MKGVISLRAFSGYRMCIHIPVEGCKGQKKVYYWFMEISGKAVKDKILERIRFVLLRR